MGFNGSIQIATLLVEKGAEVDPPLPDNKLYYVSTTHSLPICEGMDCTDVCVKYSYDGLHC